MPLLLSLGEVRALVRGVLLEGRLEDAKRRFPDVDVDYLAARDPSGGKRKYLMWMAKQVSKGARLEDLLPTVSYFHKNVKRFDKRDINSYKTLKELEDTVKDVSARRSVSRGEVKASGS